MRVNFNQPVVNTEKKTVHNIVILDSSGSMRGSKWNNAVNMVNLEFEEYRKQNDVNLTYSVVIFSSEAKIVQWKESSPRPINIVSDYIGWGTALNDTIGITLDKLYNEFTNDHVLVKIATDGEECSSRSYTSFQVRDLIQKAQEKGWTVTFAGTEKDVQTAQRLYGVDASNTVVHDNTGAGFEKMSKETIIATRQMMSNYAAGQDVSKGFYKTINTITNDEN